MRGLFLSKYGMQSLLVLYTHVLHISPLDWNMVSSQHNSIFEIQLGFSAIMATSNGSFQEHKLYDVYYKQRYII